jgi:signal-transduction protein with cAMP-binding, CBS, and nucleotidyltransferase domain
MLPITVLALLMIFQSEFKNILDLIIRTELNSTGNKEQVVDISTLDKIEAHGLIEDFELIKKMVLDVHPGTYRYNKKKDY